MKTICLHLGAHKTGSTHFQHCLHHLAHQLPDDVRVLLPRDTRDLLNPGRRLKSSAKRDASLEALTASASHIVLSEENFIGESCHIFAHNRLYEDLTHRLTYLQSFTDNADQVRILFAIRNMADFLPAVYLESLRWMPHFRKFGEAYQGYSDHSWVNVIQAIQSVFPLAKVAVVPFEAYPEVIPQMLSFFCLDGTLPAPMLERKIHRSPGYWALQVYQYISYILPKTLQKDLFRRLAPALSFTSKKFEPFSAEQKQCLTDQYQRDLQILKTLPGVTTLGVSS